MQEKMRPAVLAWQVGRAGRTAEAAWCHLFLLDSDFARLRSLSNSDGLDALVVERFLGQVFAQPQGAQQGRLGADGGGHRVLVLSKLAAEMDMKEAVLETLLSYLEVSCA